MSADTTIEIHFDKKILLQYIVDAFQNIFKPQASMKGFYTNCHNTELSADD